MASVNAESAYQAETRRFPASAGILLGVSLCAHLAAVVDAAFGESLPGATLFLVGQIALAFGLLRLIDGQWIFQDIRLFFVVFFSLYGITLPLIATSQSASSPGLPEAAFLYATGLLGFNLVQWWHKQPWRGVPPEVFARIRPSFVNSFLFVAMISAVLILAASLGIRFRFTIDRTQIRLLPGQLWVVMMFVLNGMAIFMFAGWRQLGRRSRLVLVVSTAVFIVFQVSLGNRRDFLPLLIAVAAMSATRRGSVIRFGTLATGFIAFALLTVVGVVRQVRLYPGLLLRNPVELFLGNNEFVTPIETLAFYATKHRPLLWGWTYLSSPSLFFPRAFWPEKPESLSIQFLRDAFGRISGQGYAYTPVTEAFVNFGWMGPFITMVILSLFLVKLVRDVGSSAALYFICFAMTVDFNRGEFGGTLYSVICAGVGFMAMRFVSQLRWAPRPGRASWHGLTPAAASRQGGT